MSKVSGPCAAVECDRVAVTRAGYCLRDYKRWKRRGTTHTITTEERFFSHVAQSGDCWVWTAFRQSAGGYGKFSLNNRCLLAHRWSYTFLRAEIPPTLDLDHLCRNTACVNPWHLEPVTERVNVVVRGTGITAVNARKTRCLNGHEFTSENTYVGTTGANAGKRVCRTCRAVTRKRYLSKLR